MNDVSEILNFYVHFLSEEEKEIIFGFGFEIKCYFNWTAKGTASLKSKMRWQRNQPNAFYWITILLEFPST